MVNFKYAIISRFSRDSKVEALAKKLAQSGLHLADGTFATIGLANANASVKDFP